MFHCNSGVHSRPHTSQPSNRSRARSSSCRFAALSSALPHALISTTNDFVVSRFGSDLGFALSLQPTPRAVTATRTSQRISAAVDFESVLLDQAVDVIAIDAGFRGRARNVAVMAREQRRQII